MVTYLLIGITAIVSFLAFNNQRRQHDLMLYPVAMKHPLQSYRLLTSGFVHADTMHLIFNMLTLYFFGPLLEKIIGWDKFLMLYLSAIVVANLPSYYKNMNNPQYASLGASGGVAAVIFASIYFFPWEKICLFFAICVPAIIFAVLYLLYSIYMSKKSNQQINHNAHFVGSIYGILYMLIIDPSHGADFIKRISDVSIF